MSDPTAQVGPGGAGPVVVVGSINIDHIVRADAFPSRGETVLGTSCVTALGGKGANQAIAAARYGCPVAMIGQVGDDDAGAFATDHLGKAGVDASAIDTNAGVPTGSAWITVAGGDNTIVVIPAANSHWPGSDEALVPLDTAAMVLAQLEIPVEVVQRVARRTAGVFILNAAPALPLPDELVERCDVLIVNEHELATLAGVSVVVGDFAAVVAAQEKLLTRGAAAVVTTLGRHGAILCTPAQTLHQPAPGVAAIDTTGAGDAFCGVFAAALAGGHPLDGALQWGVAAGSLAVQSPTAQAPIDPAQLHAALAALPPSTAL